MQQNQNTQHEPMRSPDDLLSPADIEREYGIKESTQAVWRSVNRWGWRDDSIKVGRLSRKRRKTIEAWLEKRTGLPTSRSTESAGSR